MGTHEKTKEQLIIELQELQQANNSLKVSYEKDITVRKQAEEELRTSDALLQSAISLLPVGLWVFNAEGKIVLSSAAAQQIWAGVRYLGVDQLGEYKGWRTDSGKLIEAHEWAGARALMKGETSIEEEVEIECFDGTHKIILDTAVPLFKSDGSIDVAITINQDITERKRAEEALKESERIISEQFEKLNEAQHIAMIGSWEWNLQTNHVWWSDETYRIFGVTPQNFVPSFEANGKFIHPDDVANYGKSFEHSFQTGEPLDVELRLVTNDGLLKHCNGKGKIISDDSGQPIRFVGTMMDITERKQIEEALQESKSRYDIAMQFSKDGLYDWNLITNEIYYSPGWKKMVGYENEELINDFSVWELLTEPKDVKNTMKMVNELIEKKRDGFEMDFKMKHKQGHWVDILSRANAIFDEKGKAVRIVGTHVDITDRKLAEEEIRKLNAELEGRVALRTAQLEASNKELEAFSYSVSHDLRAPLRHVSGYVELLNKQFQSDLPEKGQHYLNSIGDSVHIMGMLIDDLLQFSRTGRMEMHKSDLDMNEIVKEVKELLSKDNPDRKIEWVLGKLPTVNGDEAMLRLVWMNLLSNAVKFTRIRKIARIEIGVRKENKELVFFVRDNGVGFDMQYAHKLFGVFQRLHSTEEFEGTGIGLANVHRIVLRQGGRTWAEAEPDNGAVFYFSIPNK